MSAGSEITSLSDGGVAGAEPPSLVFILCVGLSEHSPSLSGLATSERHSYSFNELRDNHLHHQLIAVYLKQYNNLLGEKS